jgi:hypothetical protein
MLKLKSNPKTDARMSVDLSAEIQCKMMIRFNTINAEIKV